ncbi:histone methyltransferase [Reticulomyxa filosa]|uniref:Histone methyltransferase n=1 Tax=Reticulomyxa filosa TaxID=46433 RepID=X6MYN3_RETFI|nr:histone methyltransferase [Reticulomyxa filosa]|eukprot:ETO18901.1 histone methyltransferase [Reticulomyxa filosa]
MLDVYLCEKSKKPKQPHFGSCRCEPKGFECCGNNCDNRLMKMECVDSMCQCDDRCTNRRFQKCEWCKCEVRPAGKKGFGLYANETIRRGQFVVEYVGEVIDSLQSQRRLQLEYKGSKKFYIIRLEKDLLIDATKKGNIGRFVNHSCDPNCQSEKWLLLLLYFYFYFVLFCLNKKKKKS